jgi:hypothetical protein
MALALGVHVSGLVGLAGVAPREPSSPGPQAAPDEIALDESEPEKGSATASRSSGESRASAWSLESRAGRAGAEVLAPGGSFRKPVDGDGEPGDAPEPRAGDWSFSPFALRIDTRAALSPDLVAPSGPRGTESPAPRRRSTTGGVAEALAEHDVAIGLGRGGPVLDAVEDAARSSEAPVAGTATFEVTVGRDGHVDAHVVAADGEAEGWERLAASLTSRIDPRRVRLPPGARGWRVVVRVDAREQLADGRDVRTLHGPRGSVEPSALSKALSGKGDERGSSTGPGGPDHVDSSPTDAPPLGGALGRGPTNAGLGAATGLAMRVVPTPTVSVSGKVCSAALGVTPLGIGISGGCSLENIGTGSTRVVSGRILDEGAM